MVVVEGFASSSSLCLLSLRYARAYCAVVFGKRGLSHFSFIDGVGKDAKSKVSFHHLIVFDSPRRLIGRTPSISFLPPNTIIRYWKLPFWGSSGVLDTKKAIFDLFFLIQFQTCFNPAA